MLPLLINAICRAIQQCPMIHARYDDHAGVVTRHGSVHLGTATIAPAGLMVPVVRHAERLIVWQLADQIAKMAEVARSGTIKSEELSGSTLTITSLGPGRRRQHPGHQPPGSGDGREIDGYDAASFIQAVKILIEMPVLLFTH